MTVRSQTQRTGRKGHLNPTKRPTSATTLKLNLTMQKQMWHKEKRMAKRSEAERAEEKEN